jgi:hypothetical protein
LVDKKNVSSSASQNMLATRLKLIAVLLLACAGCELPHGPIVWEPMHRGILNHRGRQSGYAQDDVCPPPAPAMTTEPAPITAGKEPHGMKQLPPTGPGVQAPWPRYHPVPTRPVFEASPPQQLPISSTTVTQKPVESTTAR